MGSEIAEMRATLTTFSPAGTTKKFRPPWHSSVNFATTKLNLNAAALVYQVTLFSCTYQAGETGRNLALLVEISPQNTSLRRLPASIPCLE